MTDSEQNPTTITAGKLNGRRSLTVHLPAKTKVVERLSPVNGKTPGKPPGKPPVPALKRARASGTGAAREANGRIFNPAFYSSDELNQISELIRFDRDFYLANHPDVASNGLDPLLHFLSHGIDEARLPSDPEHAPGGDWLKHLLGFDAVFYERLYPAAAGVQYEDFMRHGAREGRLPFDLHANVASEQLLADVLDELEIDLPHVLEEQARHAAELWEAVPGALQVQVARRGIISPRFRNNFWLGMALGLLAQCRFGAAACCYNFFFNYYIPVPFLGNAQNGLIGTGCVFTTKEGIARSGTLLATPGVPENVMISEPVFLNRPNRARPRSSEALPQPVYGILPNVEVIGGSSLMIQNGHVVLYDYLEFGERARELQSPNLLHVVGQACSFRIPSHVLEVNEAFSMLHDHGHNYHHWLLEILPRLLLARGNGLPDDIPLLIAKDTAPQIREALRLVLGREPALIAVTNRASVLVKKLHVATDISINTVHTEQEPLRSDILFSPAAIEMIREAAAPWFADRMEKYENVLILRQNVSFRRLINNGVLLEAMKPLGMWSFDPGNASWTDQVRVFSNARLIVSEAGAALANLVFCQPGAVVIVLVNGHTNSNYYYLTQLSQLVGARLYFFECLRLAGSHTIGVQDDMIASVGQLTDWVTRFLRDPGFRPPETDTASAPETCHAPNGFPVVRAAKKAGAGKRSHAGKVASA